VHQTLFGVVKALLRPLTQLNCATSLILQLLELRLLLAESLLELQQAIVSTTWDRVYSCSASRS
jgi:hypothetical protein